MSEANERRPSAEPVARPSDGSQARFLEAYALSRAGRFAAKEIGSEGVIAGDVIELIPRALTDTAPLE